WVESENIWLARVAILHQERYRERTDSEMLFAYCLRRAADREFFVRKAIGWALRSYAKVEPDLVAQFLTGHGAALSGLSRREAERGVAMGARPPDQRASWRAAGGLTQNAKRPVDSPLQLLHPSTMYHGQMQRSPSELAGLGRFEEPAVLILTSLVEGPLHG